VYCVANQNASQDRFPYSDIVGDTQDNEFVEGEQGVRRRHLVIDYLVGRSVDCGRRHGVQKQFWVKVTENGSEECEDGLDV